MCTWYWLEVRIHIYSWTVRLTVHLIFLLFCWLMYLFVFSAITNLRAAQLYSARRRSYFNYCCLWWRLLNEWPTLFTIKTKFVNKNYAQPLSTHNLDGEAFLATRQHSSFDLHFFGWWKIIALNLPFGRCARHSMPPQQS